MGAVKEWGMRTGSIGGDDDDGQDAGECGAVARIVEARDAEVRCSRERGHDGPHGAQIALRAASTEDRVSVGWPNREGLARAGMVP